MRQRITMSAPVGTLHMLGTLDGWQSEGQGVFIVTDPNWSEDIKNAFGATVKEIEDTDEE